MWPQFGRCAVDRSVIGSKGDAAWQAGVDGPRGDVATRVRVVIDGGWTVRPHFSVDWASCITGIEVHGVINEDSVVRET